MKIKWPWGRKQAPRENPDGRSGRDTRPGSSESESESTSESGVERGWHGSSVDLQDGLKVVEDADVTVPDPLGPPELRRGKGRR
jgi:hypothetical protein